MQTAWAERRGGGWPPTDRFPRLSLALTPFAASACAAPQPVVEVDYSSLPPKGRPEFHAEWLRDGPCDATTTCPGKPGAWCQLSLAKARNMRFGGRFSTWLARLARFFESTHRSLASSRSRAPVPVVTRILRGTGEHLRIAMSGMRQNLRGSAAVDLRRLLFSP